MFSVRVNWGNSLLQRELYCFAVSALSFLQALLLACPKCWLAAIRCFSVSRLWPRTTESRSLQVSAEPALSLEPANYCMLSRWQGLIPSSLICQPLSQLLHGFPLGLLPVSPAALHLPRSTPIENL